MDKIAIISDIHGNITALKTVLKDIHSRNINEIYCLGDSIVKCANPDLVIDTLKENCKVILKGNCDDDVCNPNVPADKYWSRRKIGEERAKFIYNLPVSYEFYMSGYLIRLFHACPFNLTSFFNPLQKLDKPNNSTISASDMFKNTEFIGKNSNDPIPDIIGYGHLHTPNLFRYKNKTIFNPGSVGMPIELNNGENGDENNRFSTLSSYTILEGLLNSKNLSSISITHIRIPYDISKEIGYLENCDMPMKNESIHDLKTASHI